MVVARPEREIDDTRLLSDPAAPPSCRRTDVWLTWYCAHGHGHSVPGRAPRRRPRQVQHDATHRTFHPDRQLEQPLPQRGDLCRGAVRAVGLLPQRLQQHLRRGRQQHAELIRPAPRATRAIQRQPVMQFLEPVFHVATLTIDGIDGGGRLAEVRHHEARIAFGLMPGPADDLRLDDDASTVRPALGRIEGLPVDVLRAAAVLRQAVGLAQQAPGAPLQPRVVGSPTTYSTRSASRKSSQSFPAKPPSTRTRTGVPGNARRS